MQVFDYLVIGGGSGGLASARRAARYGRKVGIIEYQRLGGTCVNVGCVPKKIMWNAANMVHQLKLAPDYGVNANYSLDWGVLRQNREAHIRKLNDIYANSLARQEVQVINGWGVFKDPHTLIVEGIGEFSAPHILIATGSKPMMLDIPGKEYLEDSDGFFEMQTAPQSALVIGNGYIAAQLAGVLNALGTQTKLSIRTSQFLRVFQTDLSNLLREIMEQDGIQFYPETQVVEVRKNQTDFTAVLNTGESLNVSKVFCCIGRNAMNDKMQIENSGVELLPNGFIKTNQYEETSVEGIYSLGDVNGKVQLTPVAIAAGRRLADRLFGGMAGRKLDYELIPTVMFSHPPLGTVGMTQREAREKFGEAVKVYKSRFNNLFYAVSGHKVPTLMKLICLGDQEKVIGLHGLGKDVDEMIQGFAVAIKMGATKKDFDDTVAIHPTGSEEYVTMT